MSGQDRLGVNLQTLDRAAEMPDTHHKTRRRPRTDHECCFGKRMIVNL
jgi:hypothetical protein